MQRVLWLALAGCGSGCGGGSELTLEQENNYAFTGELALETVEVASTTDLTIDWSALAVDIRGRDVTGTPDQVALLKCSGSKAEILALLDSNNLLASDCLENFLLDVPDGATSALTSTFEIGGNPLDPSKMFTETDPSEANWIASILNTSAVADDVLMSQFFDPSDASKDTTVALDDDSATFTYTVDLSSAPAVTGSGTVLDWSGVETDVFGNDWNELRGTLALVAKFDAADVSEIEADFLRLEDNAVELYRADAFGRFRVDLATAEDADGNLFTGFTSDGVWLVGVTCPACLNPSPLLLAVVDAG